MRCRILRRHASNEKWRMFGGMGCHLNEIMALCVCVCVCVGTLEGIIGAFDDESTHNTCPVHFIFRHRRRRRWQDCGNIFTDFALGSRDQYLNDFAILHISDLMRIYGRTMNAGAIKWYSVHLPLVWRCDIFFFTIFIESLNHWRRRCGRNLLYANWHRWEFRFVFLVDFIIVQFNWQRVIWMSSILIFLAVEFGGDDLFSGNVLISNK